jgi:hypothetical protein
MGLALDQVNASDPGELLVADNGASTIFGVDLLLPERQTLASGLSIPRAATFATTPLRGSTCGKLPNIDLAFVLTGEATQIRQLPDPRITMLPSAPTRVWISKGRADDPWPSDFQSADHQIAIIAEGGPGRRICFRVVDPPDLAPYADFVTTGDWCDNRDPGTSNDAEKLWNPVTSSWQSVVCLTANEHGVASTVLNTTDRFAGDNYIVQASYDTWDASNTSKALAQTGVITAWKRNYIELDEMFRKGGILKANAAAGSTTVRVHDWADLPACGSTPGTEPCYQIAIVDVDHPYEVLPGYDTVNPHDEPYVSHVTSDGDNGYILNLVHQDMTDYHLTQTYTFSPYPQFNSGKSAGIGVVGLGYYIANVGDIWQAYDDSLTEYWVPPDGRSSAPYLPPAFFDGYNKGASCPDAVQKPSYDFKPWYRFAWLWFAHHGEPNTIWVGGTGTTAPLGDCTVCPPTNNPSPQIWGSTFYADTTRVPSMQSFVFSGAIEAYCQSATQTENAARGTTNHEIGHDLLVNPTALTLLYHDDRCQWTDDGSLDCYSSPIPTCANPAYACLMNPSRDRWDSKHRFDRFDLICGDSGCPNGYPGCCDPCTWLGDGAIRNLVDAFIGVSP